MKPAHFSICLHIYIRRKVLLQKCMYLRAVEWDQRDLLGNRFIFQRGTFSHPKAFLGSIAKSKTNSWNCFSKTVRANTIHRLQHTTYSVTGLARVLADPEGVLSLISMSFPLSLSNNHWHLMQGQRFCSFLGYLISRETNHEKKIKQRHEMTNTNIMTQS